MRCGRAGLLLRGSRFGVEFGSNMLTVPDWGSLEGFKRRLKACSGGAGH